MHALGRRGGAMWTETSCKGDKTRRAVFATSGLQRPELTPHLRKHLQDCLTFRTGRQTCQTTLWLHRAKNLLMIVEGYGWQAS